MADRTAPRLSTAPRGGSDPVAELSRLIAKARQHDEQARKARQAAGIILLRSGNAAERQRLAHAVGLDARIVDLLTGMALTQPPE